MVELRLAAWDKIVARATRRVEHVGDPRTQYLAPAFQRLHTPQLLPLISYCEPQLWLSAVALG
jgi:hypothetical protein